jgi:hypothetical protein
MSWKLQRKGGVIMEGVKKSVADLPSTRKAEEEKIIQLIRQKVRENFYQVPQHVLDRMINRGIWADDLRHAVESVKELGTFEGRYTKDTMPGYEFSSGYSLWGFDYSESREIHMDCQILDSGELRIIDIDTKFY